MNLNNIENAIDNDGFVYCITGMFNQNGKYNTCKVGKIKMRNSIEGTLTSLLNRYSTYIIDCNIYMFLRVSNCHKAEKDLFKILSDVHYEKEHFFFDENKINNAFDIIKIKYPDINTIICKSSIKDISKLNNLRNMRV